MTAAISGLSAGATYHFRLVATSPAGTSLGGDRSLTTGSPALSIADASVAETNAPGSLTFTVTLSSASAQTVTVGYATSEGSALDPEDYSGGSGTLAFAPGVTSRTITSSIVATPSTRTTRHSP